MLRSILLGALAVSVATSCKRGADAPAVQPGVTGAVTATRAGATRVLVENSPISGDDTITTAADGRITILLAHNNARWELGPGNTREVAASPAWGLARQDQPAVEIDENTGAAGRHAERAAATASTDTADTEAVPTAGSPPAPTLERGFIGNTPTEPSIARPSEGDGDGRPNPDPEPSVVPAGPPPPPPAQQDLRFRGSHAQDKTAEAIKATKAPSTKAVPPKLQPKPRPTDDLSQSNSVVVAPGGSNEKLANDGKPPKSGHARSELELAASREHAALQACLVASGKPELTVVLRAVDGKPTIALQGSTATAQDRACFAKIAARIKLTVAQPAPYTVTLKR
jgi:hypothetical protein